MAHSGSFVAPFPEATAAANIGGLPVPVLLVGNKADRLGAATAGKRGSSGCDPAALAALINSSCQQALGASACGRWWRRGLSLAGLARRSSDATLASGGGSGGGSSSSMTLAPLPPEAGGTRGLTASAAAGSIDWGTLDAFFGALWERRYSPTSAGAAALFMQRVPSFGGGMHGPGEGGVLMTTGAAAAAHRDNHGTTRVDDDDNGVGGALWV